MHLTAQEFAYLWGSSKARGAVLKQLIMKLIAIQNKHPAFERDIIVQLLKRKTQFEKQCTYATFMVLWVEGDIGVCGIAVLDNFSCGIAGVLGF